MVYCQQCRQSEDAGDLTPVHVPIKGGTHLVYFHNRHGKDCLYLWLAEQRNRFAPQNPALTGTNQPE